MSLSDIIAFYTQPVTEVFGQVDAQHPAPAGHQGIDFAADGGTAIPSLSDGTVVDVSSNPNNSSNLGYYAVVQQADGSKVWYGHMQAPANVSVGQTVNAGQILGRVGNTGYSFGNHLHVGLQNASGVFVDPLSFINNALAAAANGDSNSGGFGVGLASSSDAGSLHLPKVNLPIVGNINPLAGQSTGIPDPSAAFSSAVSAAANAVSGAVSDAGKGINTIGSALTDVAKLFTWFTDAHHWWAIGFVIGGIVITGAGFVLFLQSTDTGRAAISAGTKAGALFA